MFVCLQQPKGERGSTPLLRLPPSSHAYRNPAHSFCVCSFRAALHTIVLKIGWSGLQFNSIARSFNFEWPGAVRNECLSPERRSSVTFIVPLLLNADEGDSAAAGVRRQHRLVCLLGAWQAPRSTRYHSTAPLNPIIVRCVLVASRQVECLLGENPSVSAFYTRSILFLVTPLFVIVLPLLVNDPFELHHRS